MKPEFLGVIDFEATCADKRVDPGWDPSGQEIIELPVGLVSIRERAVVGQFGTLVRPTRQPRLTAFCTALTSIRQEDLAGQPTIDVALPQMVRWLASQGATEDNCLMTTCGDWDLRHMWPRQASLVPELVTPPLFRRWCNLKVIHRRATGRKAGGMMGMLRGLGIPHRGHHHRGADDVANLCRLAIRLLEGGAAFEPTWTDTERRAERQRQQTELRELERTRDAKRRALTSLPGSVPADLRRRFEEQLAHMEDEIVAARAFAEVFRSP